MRDFGNGFLAIVTGIIGLAIVAVLVSRNAQTPQVVTGIGSALSNVITAAVRPVTGGTGSQLQFGG